MTNTIICLSGCNLSVVFRNVYVFIYKVIYICTFDTFDVGIIGSIVPQLFMFMVRSVYLHKSKNKNKRIKQYFILFFDDRQQKNPYYIKEVETTHTYSDAHIVIFIVSKL